MDKSFLRENHMPASIDRRKIVVVGETNLPCEGKEKPAQLLTSYK